MNNRFGTQSDENATVAFINVYRGKDKVADTDTLSKLADDIEAGNVKVECYLSKDGEPVLMIKL